MGATSSMMLASVKVEPGPTPSVAPPVVLPGLPQILCAANAASVMPAAVKVPLPPGFPFALPKAGNSLGAQQTSTLLSSLQRALSASSAKTGAAAPGMAVPIANGTSLAAAMAAAAAKKAAGAALAPLPAMPAAISIPPLNPTLQLAAAQKALATAMAAAKPAAATPGLPARPPAGTAVAPALAAAAVAALAAADKKRAAEATAASTSTAAAAPAVAVASSSSFTAAAAAAVAAMHESEDFDSGDYEGAEGDFGDEADATVEVGVPRRGSGTTGGRRQGTAGGAGVTKRREPKRRGGYNGRSETELMLLDPKRVKRIMANREVRLAGFQHVSCMK